MLGNAMLDVAIGLVFLFLLLSLICTTVNEFISSFLKLRAETLQQALRDLIDDKDISKGFYESPLMVAAARMSGRKGPSYLPAPVFAEAVIQTASFVATQKHVSVLTELQSTLDALPESNFKQILLAYARDAQGDIAEFKSRVGAWFDSMMDRAAGRFKRKMSLITLICAMTLSISLNADSIAIAQALWADESMREQLADAAETFVSETDYVEDLAEFAEVEDILRPIPLGWNFGDPEFVTDWYLSAGGIFLKILGLLFTGMAVSLGAPFWFDVLQKFMKLRGAGPKPEAPPTARAAQINTAAVTT